LVEPSCGCTKQLRVSGAKDLEWAKNYNESGIVLQLVCSACNGKLASEPFIVPEHFHACYRELKCLCGKKWSTPSKLERCIARHVKPYVCCICEKKQRSFDHSRIADTLNHIKRYHDVPGWELIEGVHFRVQGRDETEEKARRWR